MSLIAMAQFLVSLVNTAGCFDNGATYCVCTPDEAGEGTQLSAFVNDSGFLVIRVASGCLWALTHVAPGADVVLVDHGHHRYDTVRQEAL